MIKRQKESLMTQSDVECRKLDIKLSIKDFVAGVIEEWQKDDSFILNLNRPLISKF
jgi:hypothetical protein